MKICHNMMRLYHRCGQLDLEFTGVRDYDSRLDELKRAVFDPNISISALMFLIRLCRDRL